MNKIMKGKHYSWKRKHVPVYVNKNIEAALLKLAKQKNVSKSRMVEMILDKALGTKVFYDEDDHDHY